MRLIDAKQITKAVDRKCIRIMAVQIRMNSLCMSNRSVCLLMICVSRRMILWFSALANLRFWLIGAKIWIGYTQHSQILIRAWPNFLIWIICEINISYIFQLISDFQFHISISYIALRYANRWWEIKRLCRQSKSRCCCHLVIGPNRWWNNCDCRHQMDIWNGDNSFLSFLMTQLHSILWILTQPETVAHVQGAVQ